MKKKVIIIPIILFAMLCAAGTACYFLLNGEDSGKSSSKSSSNDDSVSVGEIYVKDIEEEHLVFDESNGTGHIDNEILVVAEEDISLKEMKKLSESYGASIVGRIEQTGDYQLEFNDVYTIEELEELAEKLSSEEIIASASLNYVETISCSSYDKKTNTIGGVNVGEDWKGEKWDEKNLKGTNWSMNMIHAPSAWEFMNEHKSDMKPVKVGLIDSGFDENHEDLDFAMTFFNEKDMDELAKGNDIDFHGTHVAGTMAARSDNKQGVCGAYPYGKGNLYGVSFCGLERDGYVIETMRYKVFLAELILRNVKVINISVNFQPFDVRNKPASIRYAKIMGDFLNRLLKKGYDFVIVNSSGNESDRVNGIVRDAEFEYWIPAINASDYPEVYDRIICVGAVDNEYKISNYSNGGQRVDIYAPGGDHISAGIINIVKCLVYSTLPQNKYGDNLNGVMIIGTSMAAPHVAGAAASVWTAAPKLTGHQVKSILLTTADKQKDGYYLLNMYSAVKKAYETKGTTSPQPEKKDSAIFGFVYEQKANDPNGIPIKDITVKAVNTPGEEYEATTDADGHFELLVPAGFYTLTINDVGYKEYTYPAKIAVKRQEITYIDEKIMLESKYEIVNAVLSEEKMWLENLDKDTSYLELADQNGSQSQVIKSSKTYCWFQDMNMDGELEFIVMGKDTTMQRYIAIYYLNDNKELSIAKQYPNTYSKVEYTIKTGPNVNNSNDKFFDYSLYGDKDGNFYYFTTQIYDDWYSLRLFTLDQNYRSSQFEIMEYNYNEKNNGGFYTDRALSLFFPTATFPSDGYMNKLNVSESDFRKKYNEIFNSLTPYKTTTNMIDVEEYRKMSDSEKRETLIRSFNTWSYKEDPTKKSPLESFVKKLK